MQLCSSLQNTSPLKTLASLADDGEVEVFRRDSAGSFFIATAYDEHVPKI